MHASIKSEEVIHAIMAHHGDVQANTMIAVLVQAADAISAAGLARRENLETYIKRLEKRGNCQFFDGVESLLQYKRAGKLE